jgi:hypothetical protein
MAVDATVVTHKDLLHPRSWLRLPNIKMYLQLDFVYKRHRRQEDWPRHPGNDGLCCGQIAHDQITCGLAARKAPIIADRRYNGEETSVLMNPTGKHLFHAVYFNESLVFYKMSIAS